jgi:hypothetical protein
METEIGSSPDYVYAKLPLGAIHEATGRECYVIGIFERVISNLTRSDDKKIDCRVKLVDIEIPDADLFPYELSQKDEILKDKEWRNMYGIIKLGGICFVSGLSLKKEDV